MNLPIHLPLALFAALALAPGAGAAPAAGGSDVPTSEAPREIAALLSLLRVSDCRFERNGRWYDGERAADHLQRLNGLKAAISLLVNTVALVAFALFGPVRWTAVAIVAPASLLGGYVGGRLARRLRPDVLRTTIVVFGVVVALWLALR